MQAFDMAKLLQATHQLQSRVKKAQQELAREEVSASAGGGLVEVTTDGTGAIKKVSIDAAVVDPGEVEMLEDLIVSAFAEAQRRARDNMENRMREAAGGFPGLGGLGGLPGLGNLLR
ncbi:MAG: YbaB/EbfC family nucleoid-associated protein [Gemmatimonadetes bacterium]|nr:YbaB/EbfC family nucleoid-associated protein [Gemmatimonadota bacterium]